MRNTPKRREKTWNFMKQESNWSGVVRVIACCVLEKSGLSYCCSYFSKLKNIKTLQEQIQIHWTLLPEIDSHGARDLTVFLSLKSVVLNKVKHSVFSFFSLTLPLSSFSSSISSCLFPFFLPLPCLLSFPFYVFNYKTISIWNTISKRTHAKHNYMQNFHIQKINMCSFLEKCLLLKLWDYVLYGSLKFYLIYKMMVH